MEYQAHLIQLYPSENVCRWLAQNVQYFEAKTFQLSNFIIDKNAAKKTDLL